MNLLFTTEVCGQKPNISKYRTLFYADVTSNTFMGGSPGLVVIGGDS